MASEGLVALEKALRTSRAPKKMWRDLVEAGLVEPARARLPGTRSYGITLAAAARLKRIAQMRLSLPGRFTIGSLALQLAANGEVGIPPDLLRSEIKQRIAHALGFLRRIVTRALGIPSSTVYYANQSKRESVVRLAVAKVAKRAARRKSPVYKDTISLVVTILLRTLYVGPDVTYLARSVKEALLPEMSPDVPGHGKIGMPYHAVLALATAIVQLLSSVPNVLILNEAENPAIRALDEIPDERLLQVVAAWPQVIKTMWKRYGEVGELTGLQLPSGKWRTAIDDMLLAVLGCAAVREQPTEVMIDVLSGSQKLLDDLLSKIVMVIKIRKRFKELLTRKREEHDAGVERSDDRRIRSKPQRGAGSSDRPRLLPS